MICRIYLFPVICKQLYSYSHYLSIKYFIPTLFIILKKKKIDEGNVLLIHFNFKITHQHCSQIKLSNRK